MGLRILSLFNHFFNEEQNIREFQWKIGKGNFSFFF